MSKQKVVLTIGTFDGVHRGHVEIIRCLLEKAKKARCVSLVLSIIRPPRSIIKREMHDLLTPWSEKSERLEGLGVDKVERARFTHEFRSMTPARFIKSYLLKRYDVKGIVAGEDFHFGKGKKGDVGLLKKICVPLGIPVWVIKKKKFHGRVISSSRIRDAVLSGNIRSVNSMLGYNFRIIGGVYSDQRIGRRIGIPTMNIAAHKDKMLPSGVFEARVLGIGKWAGKVFPAVCNIGFRPTVAGITEHCGVKRDKKTVEAHVLGDTTGIKKDRVVLELLSRLRDEKKFSSLKLLKKQILSDIGMALKRC